jgi:hypothetical protein
MAKKEVTDALEAAKITQASAPKSEPPPKKEESAEEPQLPPPPKGTEAPASAGEFRVTARIQVSWGGQFIRLNPGDIVSEKLYGAGAVEKLRNAGVALEPVG